MRGLNTSKILSRYLITSDALKGHPNLEQMFEYSDIESKKMLGLEVINKYGKRKIEYVLLTETKETFDSLSKLLNFSKEIYKNENPLYDMLVTNYIDFELLKGN